jgi:hypothetical protein
VHCRLLRFGVYGGAHYRRTKQLGQSLRARESITYDAIRCRERLREPVPLSFTSEDLELLKRLGMTL